MGLELALREQEPPVLPSRRARAAHAEHSHRLHSFPTEQLFLFWEVTVPPLCCLNPDSSPISHPCVLCLPPSRRQRSCCPPALWQNTPKSTPRGEGQSTSHSSVGIVQKKSHLFLGNLFTHTLATAGFPTPILSIWLAVERTRTNTHPTPKCSRLCHFARRCSWPRSSCTKALMAELQLKFLSLSPVADALTGSLPTQSSPAQPLLPDRQ